MRPIFLPVLNSSKVSTQFNRNGASCVALFLASIAALILAGYGVKVLEHELGEDGSNKLYSSGGLVRNRNDNNWKTASTGPSKISTFSGAVPKKRI